MNDEQLLRYSRHILLDDIGIEGQEKILAAHAVVIGAGGLGSPAALYLASAGVGRITLVDGDEVDLTNLQRQVVHTTARVGSAKVDAQSSNARHFSAFRDMPRLERGQEYLLFLTAESRIALSSPVGLVQGLFEIDTSIPSEPTANRMNNAGLMADVAKGPLPYAELASRVRSIVAEQGEKR